MENYETLIEELRKYSDETPWLEFKHNNYSPEMIGKDISALANSAALHDKSCAYMIWGIDDTTHEIVGTDYNLQTLRKGKQELENWLRSLLSDNAEFEFHTIKMNNLDVGVLIIYKAASYTVTFEKVDYIRVGSYTKKLMEYPTLQAQLWDKIRNSCYEERLAKQDLSLHDALSYLNCAKYFELKELPYPTDMEGVAHYMLEEGLIDRQDNGLYAVTNMGAILFANHLTDFKRLERKAVRAVQYSGNNRMQITRETEESTGYVCCFEELMKIVSAYTPALEVIGKEDGLRRTVNEYPPIAVRESIANALIHQDFSVTGTGPLIEVFSDRIEFTNSGRPLVDIRRIIDNPPRSRNEKVASLMRKLHICEELGTGWDKIVIACELEQLPAPMIEVYEESTKLTLYAAKPFSDLSKEERVWACYLHACIRYVQSEQLTNSSLRERFALPGNASASVSRLIKEVVDLKLIKPLDPNTAPKHMKYIPIWG